MSSFKSDSFPEGSFLRSHSEAGSSVRHPKRIGVEDEGSNKIAQGHDIWLSDQNNRVFFAPEEGISLETVVLPQRSNLSRASRTNVYLSSSRTGHPLIRTPSFYEIGET